VARHLPVFCEKPLAPTLADCHRIADLLGQVPHQVGLVLRHAPVFRNLAAIVHSGQHGRPMALVLRDDQYFPIQGMYGSTWRSDVAKAGGGTLIEHSIQISTSSAGARSRSRSPPARRRFGYEGIDDVAPQLVRGRGHGLAG
jgi:predicted dehydrogenase